MNTIHVSVGGMSCGHCVKHVRDAIASVPGAEAADVRVGAAVVRIEQGSPPEAVLRAIRDAGYEATISEAHR